MSEDRMSIKELAEYLSVPVETLYKYVPAGTIPAYKDGRRWVNERTSIVQWIAERASKNKVPRTLNM